jgi:hypothetical protein
MCCRLRAEDRPFTWTIADSLDVAGWDWWEFESFPPSLIREAKPLVNGLAAWV